MLMHLLLLASLFVWLHKLMLMHLLACLHLPIHLIPFAFLLCLHLCLLA
jgi:hypothetical protein